MQLKSIKASYKVASGVKGGDAQKVHQDPYKVASGVKEVDDAKQRRDPYNTTSLRLCKPSMRTSVTGVLEESFNKCCGTYVDGSVVLHVNA